MLILALLSIAVYPKAVHQLLWHMLSCSECPAFTIGQLSFIELLTVLDVGWLCMSSVSSSGRFIQTQPYLTHGRAALTQVVESVDGRRPNTSPARVYCMIQELS